MVFCAAASGGDDPAFARHCLPAIAQAIVAQTEETRMKRFEGKVIAIAGGSGGIGGGVSHRLAAEGAVVMVGDFNLEGAERTAAEIKAKGGKAVPVHLDMGDEASVTAFVQRTVKEHGGLDGFHVNGLDSSRVPEDMDLTTMDMAAFDYMMDKNMRGYVLCTRHAVPELIKRGGGAMLYTSSGAVYMAEPVRPTYAMGKSAINALSRHVASRWGKQGVRSNVISPGMIWHDAVERAMGPAAKAQIVEGLKVTRIGEPRDIAAMAALLLSEDGGFITGQVMCVDGGATMRA
jgi:NAD(P)-dependent dehydrogenase (short-subunit alcohol dehydrogenase family)